MQKKHQVNDKDNRGRLSPLHRLQRQSYVVNQGQPPIGNHLSDPLHVK